MTDSFYIILPSNVKSEVINKQSNYTTNLPITKNLIGNWEVALVEFMYPYSWNNINSSKDKIRHNMNNNEILIRYKDNSSDIIVLKEGIYDNVIKIIQSLNIKLKTLGVNIIYDESTKRVTCKLNSDTIHYVIFSTKLQFILGLKYSVLLDENTISKYPVSLSGDMNSLFIYSDIVESTIVGDSLVPLLRICEIEGKHGDIINKTFPIPHYIPVRVNNLHSIEIDIKDDNNTNIPFVYGICIVKLHFRRVNPLF